jgi:hypothetical protein
MHLSGKLFFVYLVVQLATQLLSEGFNVSSVLFSLFDYGEDRYKKLHQTATTSIINQVPKSYIY